MQFKNFLARLGYLFNFALMYGVTAALLWLFALTPLLNGQQVQAQIFELPKSLTANQNSSNIVIKDKPVRLLIPSLNIDTRILDGEYNPEDKSWKLSGGNPHFALQTAPANDTAGNTFIYGHNNKNVFGPLTKLGNGAKATIITAKGLRFNYTFSQASNFNPEDTKIFRYKGKPILTLQTCTGAWNELRRMYTFNFDSVE